MAKNNNLWIPVTAAAEKVVDISLTSPMTLVGHGLGVGETIDIQICTDQDRSVFVDCYKDGVQVQISVTNNPVTVYGPGVFKIKKGITAGEVGCVQVLPI